MIMEIPNNRMWREFDIPLFLNLLLLLGFGLVTLLGATMHVSTHDHYFYLQLRWVLVGLFLMFLTLFVDSNVFEKGAPIFYLFAVGILVYMLQFTEGGARQVGRWIRIGGYQVQPAEPTKIMVVLMLAWVLARCTPMRGRNLLKGLLGVAVVGGVPFLLVALQPNLGTAAVYLITMIAMLWAARVQRRLMLAMFCGAALVAAVGHPLLIKDYHKKRLMSFTEKIDPNKPVKSEHFQPLQAIIAQGSGQIFGKGLGKGTQTGMRFLPEYHNDYIFCSLSEQFGFAGSAVAVGLFSIFVIQCFSMARKTRDLFSVYAIVGLATIIASHMIINLGMVLRLLPVIGLPLSFFSYGGSFMLTNLVIVGIILNLRMRRHLFS